MTLGIILSPGDSFSSLATSGQDVRFIGEYLTRYARRFDHVFVFSYAQETVELPKGVTLVPNRFRLHRFVYAILLPFLNARVLRSCSILRVLQAPGALPAVIARWRFHIPFAVTYGYDYERLARNANKPLQSLVLRFGILPLLRTAAVVIVTTESRFRSLQNAGIHSLALLPNGVDLKKFFPVEHTNKVFSIVYVGRMEREKNLSLLIDAVGASSLRDHVEIHCIGRGSESDPLQRRAAARGIRFAYRENVPHTSLPAVFQRADLFALLSPSEGHPKVLLEALSCGVPCLVSAGVGSIVGLRDGHDAILTNLTLDAVRAHLEHLTKDGILRTRLGKNARVFAEQRFDIDHILNKETLLLQKLCRPNLER